MVLDLGAHIGSFTGRALAVGAEFVRAIEPEPGNIELFRKNVDSPRAELIEGAAAVTESRTATLNLKPGASDSHSLTRKSRGGESIEVKTYSLKDLCEGLEPTWLKVDIEGGEYGLDLFESMPDSVTRLFIEWHFHRKVFVEMATDHRRKLLDEFGFSPVWESNWTPQAWWAEGMFQR